MSEEVKKTGEEIHSYQAEMQKLLDILVHSLYTEREIFLRELISNASDALNKIQFSALTNNDVLDKDSKLEIKLSFDDKENTLVIEDNGCGITKEELINNLGTIASSGTLRFLQEIRKGDNKIDNLIGQFGVGFYSVFMVAKKVVLTTRSWHKDSEAWEWSSEGTAQYTLKPIEKEHRGTRIEVHLKEDATEFCSEHRLESIVKKHSNYIPFPIILKDKTLNQVKALWAQSKSEIKPEEYEEFYKQVTHDFQTPMTHLHLSIDAPIQYYAVLYVPKEITNEVLYAREGKGISLYAQRVLIQSDNKHLLPPYLRFIQGVVDSEDLPLNVSRESVQHNALIEKIKKSVTSRVLKEFKNLSETNAETYKDFWKQYGVLLKEGVTSDFSNKEKLLDLLRFNSSIHDDAESTVSLSDYVSRMREEQKEIYYVVGPSREAIQHNPNMEYFKKQGLEVLYLFDHIDDFLMMDLREYQGKSFKSISQADIDGLKDDQAPSTEDALSSEDSQSILKVIKDQLGDRIAEVVESKRLVDSPCSLVNPQEAMSSHMEKMMKMVNKDYQTSKRNLEINMSHKIILNLSSLLKKDQESSFIKDTVEQLFNNALLVEGLLDNPLDVLPSIYKFMEDASEFQLKK